MHQPGHIDSFIQKIALMPYKGRNYASYYRIYKDCIPSVFYRRKATPFPVLNWTGTGIFKGRRL
jgi:hypothetical protein